MGGMQVALHGALVLDIRVRVEDVPEEAEDEAADADGKANPLEDGLVEFDLEILKSKHAKRGACSKF